MKIFISILILLFSFSISFACTCRDDKSTKDYIRDSRAIFVGKIVSIKEQSESKDEFGKNVIPRFSDAKVEVIKVWKGVEKSEITIEVDHSTCQEAIEEGKIVLIFAYGNNLHEGGRCSRLYVTEEDLKNEFGEGKVVEKLTQTENLESFWSSIWQKIVSFFS